MQYKLDNSLVLSTIIDLAEMTHLMCTFAKKDNKNDLYSTTEKKALIYNKFLLNNTKKQKHFQQKITDTNITT